MALEQVNRLNKFFTCSNVIRDNDTRATQPEYERRSTSQVSRGAHDDHDLAV
jgi:hypothetical protein